MVISYQLPAECRCGCGRTWWRHRRGDLWQCDNCLTEAVLRLNPSEPGERPLRTGGSDGMWPWLYNERSCLADGLPIEAICKGIASLAVEVMPTLTWDCRGEMRVSGYPGTGATQAEAIRNAFADLWEEDRRAPRGLR